MHIVTAVVVVIGIVDVNGNRKLVIIDVRRFASPFSLVGIIVIGTSRANRESRRALRNHLGTLFGIRRCRGW